MAKAGMMKFKQVILPTASLLLRSVGRPPAGNAIPWDRESLPQSLKTLSEERAKFPLGRTLMGS